MRMLIFYSFTFSFPLLVWKWNRDRVVVVVKRVGSGKKKNREAETRGVVERRRLTIRSIVEFRRERERSFSALVLLAPFFSAAEDAAQLRR